MLAPILRRSGGATHIVDGVTVVDCQKQVQSWRLLKSIVQFLTPSCNCNTFEEEEEVDKPPQGKYYRNDYYRYIKRTLIPTNTTTITGTMFGYRRGKVNFCIQANSNSIIPILILELAIPTALLAKEMKSGLLRIALECNNQYPSTENSKRPPRSSSCSSLLSVPVWNMYCNGRKAGFATKRAPTQGDRNILRLMKNVVVGVGTIDGKTLDHCDDELMYLRANFERVSGSSDSESFHLINPDGSTCQELSIFFLRSR